jgi:hypothetical protein
VLFHLALLPPAWEWQCVVDTSLASPDDIATAGHGARLPLADRCEAEGRSLVLLRAVRPDEPGSDAGGESRQHAASLT